MPSRLAVIAAISVMLIGCGKKKPPAAEDAGASVVARDGAPGAPRDAQLDPKQIVEQFDKNCIGGDLEACRSLAVMYNEGVGVPADPRRAAALFAQACNGGNLAACNHLALALSEGIGVEQDMAKAVEVYARACAGGYALACRNVGLMLRDGRGVPRDLARAETFLIKACQGGAPFGCTNAGDLDAMLAKKEGAPRYKKMIDHYELGCEAGEPAACRRIGLAYLEGTGLPKSPSAGAVWLRRACPLSDRPEDHQAVDPIACRVLGVLTLTGRGVARDVARGTELLSRACDRKDDEACRVLSTLKTAPAAPGAPGAQDVGVASPDALNTGSRGRE